MNQKKKKKTYEHKYFEEKLIAKTKATAINKANTEEKINELLI
jgi:hypothetical protein